MKRIFALLLAFGMIIGLFAGCGKSDNESGGTAAAEKKDFKNSKIVVFVSNDSEEIADVINESGRAWQEKYGGRVTYIYGTDWNQRYTKLSTLIASGEQLDVYASGTFQDIPVLPLKSFLLPVDDYLEDTAQVSVDLSKKGFAFKNKTYGFALKHLYQPMVIVYNKTMFENNGEKTPLEYYKEGKWNWENFRKAAKSLTQDHNNDGVTDQYGYGTWLPHLFMNTAGVADYIDSDYKLNLENPGITKTAQFLQQVGFKDKSILPGIWDWIDYFVAGNLAMIGERVSYLGYAKEHGLTDEVDFAPFPQDPDNKSDVKYGAWVDGVCILSNTKNAAASAEYIKNYYAPAAEKARQKTTKETNKVWHGYTDEQQKLIDEILPNAYVLNSMGFNNFGTISRGMWENIYRDGQSISTVIASEKPTLQAELDDCLADTKVDGIEEYTKIKTIDFESGMAPIVEKASGCAKLEGKLSGKQSLTVTCPETDAGSNPPVLIHTDASAAKLPSGHDYKISLKYSLAEELKGYDTVYFQIRSLSDIDSYDNGTADTLVLDSSSKKSGTLTGNINLPVSKKGNDFVLVMSYTGKGGKVVIDDISITENK